MAKPKPKGWNSMSKAKQDAWKKANFDSSTKVTKAQLDKLRAEKTPEKAIAKYKNDPAMREALNRFYGKSRVGSVAPTTSTTTRPAGGPGAKMPGRPAGGPGAKIGGDGRVKKTSQSSTGTGVGMGNSRRPGNAGVGPNKSKSPNVSATGVALAGAAALAVIKGRGGPGAKPRRAITQGLKQIETGPKGKAAQEVARAKAAAAAKTKSGVKSPNKHKMAGAPKTNPRAEASKYAKKATARATAAKAGVSNKMKAQGAKIASSATSRYNSRGKK
jgi:hypothetical protein